MTAATTVATAHPRIASREQWLAERKALLAHEKELTRQRDRINAQRRRLPMVRLEKEYRFDTPQGSRTLAQLFEGRRQLIVYHFMFDPAWEKGCSGCTGLVDSLGDLSMLAQRDTSFVLISRAPLAKLEAYKAIRGWRWPWVSSFDSDFNYDFHITLDEAKAPILYNYRDKSELLQRQETEPWFLKGEQHGLSVFFQLDGQVHHTYSTFGRGVEGLCNAYSLLDATPYGRQEDFEDSPPGWPQKPTYG
jgi:predicted dithiol-disulfide oxidoreductase (DUF899 family)